MATRRRADTQRGTTATTTADDAAQQGVVVRVAWTAAEQRHLVQRVRQQQGDVSEDDDSLRMVLHWSKTDQEGETKTIGLPYGSHPATCPIRAWRAWVAASGERRERPHLPGIVPVGSLGERAAGVALAHGDQFLEELGDEEQVAEQLAVRGAAPA
jgi:hypothetical protein